MEALAHLILHNCIQYLESGSLCGRSWELSEKPEEMIWHIFIGIPVSERENIAPFSVHKHSFELLQLAFMLFTWCLKDETKVV